jgi:hypothetical protein
MKLLCNLLKCKKAMKIMIKVRARLHCTENPIYVFPEMKLCDLAPNYMLQIYILYSQDRSAYLAAAK